LTFDGTGASTIACVKDGDGERPFLEII